MINKYIKHTTIVNNNDDDDDYIIIIFCPFLMAYYKAELKAMTIRHLLVFRSF
jgi:hypothetical protein